MIRPQVGDTVFITGNHRGFARGQVGKIMGYLGNGRARVRIGKGYWARVQVKNLKVLLDAFERGPEK